MFVLLKPAVVALLTKPILAKLNLMLISLGVKHIRALFIMGSRGLTGAVMLVMGILITTLLVCSMLVYILALLILMMAPALFYWPGQLAKG